MTYPDLNTPPRILLGPGPSSVHPRVLRTMATPVTGYMDPTFLEIIQEVRALLQQAYRTENDLTLAVSGTGTSGMEALISNLVEPGDAVLVGANGFFGERLAEMARRHGGEVERLEASWGQVFDPAQVDAALQARPAKLVAMVHAETSTGALQPEVEAVAAACHRHGALLILDCVTSLGGLPVELDAWGVDGAYSATQKCLSAPPGLAPLSLNPRGVAAIEKRSSPPPVFYLDLMLLQKQWGEQPAYHHTAPISAIFALREALRMAMEEGLETRIERHRRNAEALWAGLESLGLELFIPPAHRLPTLTTVRVPKAVDDAAIRRRLLEEFNLEIAGGFGPLAGKIWRIGLMGHSSRRENVTLLLAALAELLPG